MIERVIWIVLDSVGMGELPDADKYGDAGSNTLGNISKVVGGLSFPNMERIGLGNIDGMVGINKVKNPIGCFARFAEKSKGKDTTTGHWEMDFLYTQVDFLKKFWISWKVQQGESLFVTNRFLELL